MSTAITHHNRHTNNHSNAYMFQPRPQHFYGPNNRYYQQRRYNNYNQPFLGGHQNWQWNNFNKRPRPHDSPGESAEPKGKTAKKRRPLSQNIPSKKDWTLEEAEQALSVEKEYNKRLKNHSLIVKFPDQELNRDIVSKFHPSIENVHFQQPSTPRFCFVTLQETADADGVISALNKTRFGEGYLTAEYKKDREEDQNIGPESIDPCTLYVGNLAQEITKEDMVKMYPKGRRIDIGYAKKMKYTRYAFVSFKNVTDSVEAFKKTHSTQMYSKSLIVRFRRVHGTVGMPGESKPQSPTKKQDANNTQGQTLNERLNQEHSAINLSDQQNSIVTPDSANSDFDLIVVKQEIDSSDDEVIIVSEQDDSRFMARSINRAFEQHRPMIKKEIKEETEEIGINSSAGLQANGSNVQVKVEPQGCATTVKTEHDEDECLSGDECCKGFGVVNFDTLLHELEDHSNQIESLRTMVP